MIHQLTTLGITWAVWLMKDFEYHSPETLEEACKLLKKHKGSARVLAGGTDLIPKMHNRLLAPEHSELQ